ncbi:MarR family winged helix-turn-helix transcriptional regulator [Arthrobacter tumbae]|uniref:MarR family winged helix-turn-helix transcriptional regulator n=1 Tax=Arthrobacter tumbae TaxID=163874 RepID=UPI00195C364B|nr:MarR family transcriptional regulator [Arthrobacter tumbae]MBM7781823.1 DNA-binding MarR family transcriptional regulator [Arthrobacter tumbae]
MPNVENWSTQRLLGTAARLVEHQVNQELAAIGVTHAGVLILTALYDRGTSTQVELAKAMHVQPQTVGKTLERLEAAGLVGRSRSDADRRSLIVSITSRGRSVLAHAQEADQHFPLVTHGRHAELRALLQNVISGLAVGRPDTEGDSLDVLPASGVINIPTAFSASRSLSSSDRTL